MNTLYIMVGIQGSGKSTYAKELAKKENCVIHSTDAIRWELFGNQLNVPNDKLVFRTVRERMKKDLEEGKNVICDACNVTKRRRSSFLNEVRKLKCRKIAVVIDTDIEKCFERNSKRDDSCRIPENAIKITNERFEKPEKNEGFDEIIFIK